MDLCPRCTGSGKENPQDDCRECNGSGVIEVPGYDESEDINDDAQTYY